MTPSANEAAKKLLRIANEDAKAFRVLKAATDISFTKAGFMAQQCVEKCIKAVLISRGVIVPKIHDLVELSAMARDAGLNLPVEDDELDELTQYSVTTRYDDIAMETLTPEKAEEIVDKILSWAEGSI